MQSSFNFLSAIDHCRIGSLEIKANNGGNLPHDHCRIGSLEMADGHCRNPVDDHCRIGSLEILYCLIFCPLFDHCRIGSLETRIDNTFKISFGSLPHRQLRNQNCLLLYTFS